MSKNRAIRVSPWMEDQLAGLPVKKSAAVSQAILNAYERPHVIGEALNARRKRVYTDHDLNTVRIGLSLSVSVIDILEHLAKMTRLTDEEVVRLCTEAYIQHL